MKKEVIILSGFLGSGKTTVLQHLIQESKNTKIAILLNDFGDVPVDSSIIEDDKGDAPVIEIGGGSVFCSCLKEAFVKAMLSLTNSDAQRILVEASGMSDPSGVTRMLNLAKLDVFYEDPLIICLFDPQRSLKLAKVLEVIPRQIRAAHVVVLTKSDITTKEERNAAREYILSVQNNVPIIESSQGHVDLHTLQTFTNSASVASFMSFNTPETRPDSFVIKDPVKNLGVLIQTLQNAESLLRVKGYVTTEQGFVFITDDHTGIRVTPSSAAPVPLTVICMQGQGNELQKLLQESIFA